MQKAYIANNFEVYKWHLWILCLPQNQVCGMTGWHPCNSQHAVSNYCRHPRCSHGDSFCCFSLVLFDCLLFLHIWMLKTTCNKHHLVSVSLSYIHCFNYNMTRKLSLLYGHNTPTTGSEIGLVLWRLLAGITISIRHWKTSSNLYQPLVYV